MSFQIKINEKSLEFEINIVSGSDILEKGGYLPIEKYDLFKKIQGKEFEPIQNDERVDLAEPGIEKFRVIARKELTFMVDDEPYSTKEVELTPIDIFKIIGKSNEQYYLKELKEHMEITYKSDEYKIIDMIGQLIFITCKREPTTVS